LSSLNIDLIINLKNGKMEGLTRAEKERKMSVIDRKRIYISRQLKEMESSILKGDDEIWLLFKLLKEKVKNHNSKLDSQFNKMMNKGTID
jgi:hypothetical protein